MTVATAPLGTTWVNQENYDELEDETRQLIKLLKHEVGVRWMSFELQLQVEKVEVIMGDAGTMGAGMTQVVDD